MEGFLDGGWDELGRKLWGRFGLGCTIDLWRDWTPKSYFVSSIELKVGLA